MKYRAISENHLYRKAYAKGKKAVTKTVVVYVLKDLHAKRLQNAHPQKKKINRVGLTVTKKIGNAVVRSRTKRVIREAFRLTDRTYGVKRGYLIVLVAREAASRVKSTVIQKDLFAAFASLSMLEKNGTASAEPSHAKQ